MNVDLDFLRDSRAKVEAAWETYSVSEYKNSLRAHDAWFQAKADFEQYAVKYVDQLLSETASGTEAAEGGQDPAGLDPKDDGPVGNAETPPPEAPTSRVGEE